MVKPTIGYWYRTGELFVKFLPCDSKGFHKVIVVGPDSPKSMLVADFKVDQYKWSNIDIARRELLDRLYA